MFKWDIFRSFIVFYMFCIFSWLNMYWNICSSSKKNEGGIYFGIAFLGFLIILSIYGILASALKEIVTFEDTGLKIVTIIIFCCIPKTKFHKYSEFKRFEVETLDKKNYIIYYDTNNDKKYLFGNNFTLEEAEYFVYFANKYIDVSL